MPPTRIGTSPASWQAAISAFAAAVRSEAPYPLPVEDAIHGVAVFEAMIGAAASGSSYAVA